jgi:hypothetical protein
MLCFPGLVKKLRKSCKLINSCINCLQKLTRQVVRVRARHIPSINNSLILTINIAL